METTQKKEYILENLCCGNCAMEIEREVGRLRGVNSSNVDFISKTLYLETEKGEASAALFRRIETIAQKHDADIILREKEPAAPGKKILYLSGVDCAACAQKIEEAAAALPGVKAAHLDFVTQRMSVEAEDCKALPSVLRAVSQAAREVEPNLEISFTEKKPAEDDSAGRKKRSSRIRLIIGAALFAVGFLFPFPRPVELAIFLASLVLIGGEVFLRALRNMTRGKIFDENFLMSVATIGAFMIGDYPEGTAVMLFYQIGELLQDLAVSRSRRSISTLMDIRPDYANLQGKDGIRKVSPEEVGVGDRIVVRPGEKIPLDGTIVEGQSSLDTSALTGESLPRDVSAGDGVLSGSVNTSGLLTVEVTKEFGESTVYKILNLVQNASSQKAPTENFITKFARYYTPIVVFAALALAIIPPLFLPGMPFAQWINRGLIFLVVSCPCALVVSIPLSFFGGIGGASKNGILVKGGNFLEALNHVDTVVFDKTGTLTRGSFKVTKIQPANGFSRDQILALAAHAEAFSNHPIAVSIRDAYGRAPDIQRISDYAESPGHGIRVSIDGKTILAGNGKWMQEQAIIWEQAAEPGTIVYLAVDGTFAGYFVISDEIRPDSLQALEGLKRMGIRRNVMLTGDSSAAGEKVGRDLGLDAVYAELLPQQKVEQLEKLSQDAAPGGKLVFVGDGINDAPVLARADVGVAMGGLGSDAAIEAADIVLMTDEPSKLATAVRIARKTHRIVWQNIIFALGVKAVLLVLGALGLANMWEAVFGDVGVTIIAVLNAARAMRS